MKMSGLFGQTLRKPPADAQVASHRLLVQAGFIRQLGAGIFSYLHLARRSMTKIENILRDEMNAIGGQEITMPVVHPADLWKKTGRWYQIGSEMGRFYDKNDRDMVLAMTHEEVIADLVRTEIQSYKQLPRLLYHIQTKWRDDPRPRAGLIRVREFTMKDSYSLDADWEGLDVQYRAHYRAYLNIFHRCGLPVVAVKSDVGMMGGKVAHEFMYLTPIGEDTLILCDECGHKANRQVARFQKPTPMEEKPRPIKKVATPGVTTIEGLAKFLGVPESKTAKAVFRVATVTEGQKDVEKFVFAVVRGDMDVNETKLANAVKAKSLRPARDEEIRDIGAIPGYASPRYGRGWMCLSRLWCCYALLEGGGSRQYFQARRPLLRVYRGYIPGQRWTSQASDHGVLRHWCWASISMCGRRIPRRAGPLMAGYGSALSRLYSRFARR
jgi:prolyl-tRNA synthetase